MKTSLALVCGRCDHENIKSSACFVLFVAVCIRVLMIIGLGFTNAKSKGGHGRSTINYSACLLAIIDIVCSFLPIAYSVSDFAYVHGIDAFFSCIAWCMFIDVMRSKSISLYAAACSSLALVSVDCVLAYGIVQGTFVFRYNASPYDSSMAVGTAIRIGCSFGMAVVITYAALSDHGFVPWINEDKADFQLRSYKSESSSAARVSLMQYPPGWVDGANEYHHHFIQLPTDNDSCTGNGVGATGVDVSNGPVEVFESYYSLLLVSSVTDLFVLAKKTSLTPDHIPRLASDRSSGIHSNAVRHMLMLSHAEDKRSPLLHVLRILYLSEYLAAGGLLLIKSLSVFVGPIMLDQLVQAAENDSSWNVIGCYIAILFVSKIVGAFSSAHYNLACQSISVAIAGGLKGALYQKVLRLSSASRQRYTIGNISNLCTVDADRVVNVTIALHNFWALPLQIVIAMVLLWWVVSYAMLAGLGMIVLVLIVNNIIAKKTKVATDRVMQNKDVRMKNISEAFGAMLTIKLNAWEGQFEQKILASREEELRHVWKVLLIGAMNVFVLWIAPSMVSVSTVVMYTKVMGRDVTAASIFTALSLFRLLQGPLRALPGFITQFFQALTSLDRLQCFFELEEKTFKGLFTNEYNSSGEGKVPATDGSQYEVWKDGDLGAIKGEISVISAQFYWTALSQSPDGPSFRAESSQQEAAGASEDDTAISFELKIPSCFVEPGSLVIIRGAVGMGKSSFCQALLGEMPIAGGTRKVRGTVAYACQQAWIQSATLKENIVFGLPYDHLKYQRVVDACCLVQDFDELPDADDTYIGQKGLNLSGGQKARCALARAVYADSDIYILDDVFAALDSIVGKCVFERVVLGLLCRKTRVIVTHKEDFIRHAAVSARYEISDGVLHCEDSKTESDAVISDADNVSEMDTGQKSPTFYCGVTSVALVPYKFSCVVDDCCLTRTDSSQRGGGDKSGGIRSAEEQVTGKLDWRVYSGYVKAAGGLSVVIALFTIQTAWQLLSVGSDYFITQWSRQDEEQQKKNMDENIGIYAGLALGSGLLVLVRTLTVSTFGFRAAKRLFEDMLRSLVHAPMHWMDRNPTGRLLNRFGDDQAQIDEGVPFSAGSVFSTVFSVSGSVVTVLVITRYLGLFIIPTAYIYYLLMQMYLNAAREVQRMQSVSKSPMLTFISESVDGLIQLRSFGNDSIWRAVERNESMLDEYLSVTYVMAAGVAWFSLRIQLIGAFLILFVAVVLFIGSSSFISTGLIALSLSYMLSISDDIMGLVMIWSWFEQAMVCPERVLQYVDLEREGTEKQKRLFKCDPEVPSDSLVFDAASEDILSLLRKGDGDSIPLLEACVDRENEIAGMVLSRADWPKEGVVEYRNVYFRYQPNQSDFVLVDLSFKTRPAEKIGIVGRTGAGKSSLTMSLFRIAELSRGQIFIDGVDISLLSLPCLRSAIEIVPQAPVLFKGTIRNYLDPFEEYSDTQVWAALQKAHVADMVMQIAKIQRLGGMDSLARSSGRGDRDSQLIPISEALEVELAENGENLSVGQRQMLVLSRALLRESKVLVMDEATAAMDYNTDRQLQLVLHQEFKTATVITIAHRIDSILSCDRVIVMAAGSIIEFDTPKHLLQNPDSMFHQLAAEAGIDIFGNVASR